MGVVKKLIGKIARDAGYDITRKNNGYFDRRVAFFNQHGITVVLDVGANVGQYASRIRSLGYKGRIESFEPEPESFAKLQQHFSADHDWRGHQVAVGASRGEVLLQVSEKRSLSSVLSPNTNLAGSLPGASVEKTEPVRMESIDSVWSSVVRPDDIVALKVDTQGFESEVLRGARESLADVSILEVELAFAEFYEGQRLLYEMIPEIRDLGFRLIDIDDSRRSSHEVHPMIDTDTLWVRDG